MHEVIGVEIIPMPWESVSCLPHDESWTEIIEHCFTNDPLPWCKKEEDELHDTSAGTLGADSGIHPGNADHGTRDKDFRAPGLPGNNGGMAVRSNLRAGLYSYRVFSSAGERLPDTEEAGGSTPLTPTRGLVPYSGARKLHGCLRRNYRDSLGVNHGT
jgi:hypothetical protein